MTAAISSNQVRICERLLPDSFLSVAMTTYVTASFDRQLLLAQLPQASHSSGLSSEHNICACASVIIV